MSAGASEEIRYSRQIQIEAIGPEGQRKIQSSKVLIVGVGGLGCAALQSLAGAGVGYLGIWDFDRVALSNLNRQFLYTEEDVGELKVHCAKRAVKKLNPHVRVTCYESKADEKSLESVIPNYDVVVDACDDAALRYILDGLCERLAMPLVFGASEGFKALLTCFAPDSNQRLRGIFPEPKYKPVSKACLSKGALGALTSTVGHLQALQAIQILLDYSSFGFGQILELQSLKLKLIKIALLKSARKINLSNIC